MSISRLNQFVLVVSTLGASWIAMQAVHELGHVIGAFVSGGRVARVVLDPLSFSRTEMAENPRPLCVAWAGPVFGATAPLGIWAVAGALRVPGVFLARFFAGFCLVANGAYVAGGSFHGLGDAGEMLRNGSASWLLWAFGAVTIPGGLWLWHGQGGHFGLAEARGRVDPRAAHGALAPLFGALDSGIRVLRRVAADSAMRSPEILMLGNWPV